jgi:cell division septation protein DedD
MAFEGWLKGVKLMFSDDDDELDTTEADETTEAEETEAEASAPKPKASKPKVKVAKTVAKAAKAAKAPEASAAKGNGTPKAARKPRTTDPAKLDQFGLRLGSLKSKAAAMYATKNGATLDEVKEALDSTQFNVLTELGKKGFKIDKTAVSGKAERKVTKYKLHV